MCTAYNSLGKFRCWLENFNWRLACENSFCMYACDLVRLLSSCRKNHASCRYPWKVLASTHSCRCLQDVPTADKLLCVRLPSGAEHDFLNCECTWSTTNPCSAEHIFSLTKIMPSAFSPCRQRWKRATASSAQQPAINTCSDMQHAAFIAHL